MLRAMRSALGATSHSLSCLRPSWSPHRNDRIKQSGVESGTKTPPVTGSYPGVCSGWDDRGGVAGYGVCVRVAMSGRIKGKRHQRRGFSFFLFFFQIK